MNIFLIPGLGVDARVFYKLKNEWFEFTVLEWIVPFHSEPLEQYARRMGIPLIGKENILLIGLSFGGMVATEMAKIYPCKLILLSSVKHQEELPYYIHITKRLKFYSLLSGNFYKFLGKLSWRIFGDLTKEDAALFKEMINDSHLYYFKWAVVKVIEYSNKIYPENVVHLQGTQDHIFPYHKIKIATPVGGADHMMILTHPDKVIQCLTKIIEKDMETS